MTTASRLVLARKRRGLTVTRLAQMAGLTPRRLSDFENGRATPSPPSLEAIATALEFPSSFFSAEEVAELTVDSVSFRALSKMTASQRDIALSSGRLARALQDWMGAHFRLPAPDIPSLTSFSRLRSDEDQIPVPGRRPARTSQRRKPPPWCAHAGGSGTRRSRMWCTCWRRMAFASSPFQGLS